MLEPVQSEFTTVNGLRIHYLRAGSSGPPLLLLHGSAIDSSRLSYGPSMPRLAKDFSVYAPDWPGYGLSQPAPKPSDFVFYGEFVKAFLDTFGLDHVHVVGFSMGAAALLEFVLHHPKRVGKLVLISAYGLSTDLHMPIAPYLALRVPKLDAFAWAAVRHQKMLIRWILKAFIFARPQLVTEGLVDEVHQQLMAPGVEETFMDWLRGEMRPASFRTSYREQLKHVHTPTLLLHGTRDLIIPASRTKRAAKLIPNAELKLIPKCGHWLTREARAEFEKELLAFLKRTPEIK